MLKHVQAKHNVQISGQADATILFVHGYGCDQTIWRFVAPAFANDYRVVLPDLVGSGKSDLAAYDPEKYSTLYGHAADIIALCDALGLKSVIFVGHSVAATIGVLAHNRRPDLFERVIMLTPSPCYINDEDYYGGFERSDIDELIDLLDSNYLGWSSSITPVIMGNPERPQLTQELRDRFCSNDPDIATHFAKVTFLGDYREEFARLRAETLIMQASNDVIAPEKVGAYLHQHIPTSHLVIMEAQGHCPHISAPEETTALIRQYLQATVA